LSIFKGRVNNGSQDGKVFSSIKHLELAGYFLFYLDITDGSFCTIVIGRNIWMIEEGKDMITILDYSLLKRNQLFVVWLQRLTQQIIQISIQMVSGMIGVIIINRSKLFFKSLHFHQHNPEPNWIHRWV